MQFPYVKCEGDFGSIYRPYLPVTFSYGSKSFAVGHALVDTGADITILPLEIAHVLDIELDDSERVRIGAAGGGLCVALPSRKKVGYAVEQKGFRPLCWSGTVYFAEGQPMVLLGGHQCLDQLHLTFHGPERKMEILKRPQVDS